MLKELFEVISFIVDFKSSNPDADKEKVEFATSKKFQFSLHRSLYRASNFALRFSHAKSESFSNTILSLSALKKFDNIPVVVCIVRPTGVEFLLANSTFIRKISHSSHKLTIDNLKGSFNGTDILRIWSGITNEPVNFVELFTHHKETDWGSNLQRIVQETSGIQPTGVKFEPNVVQLGNIYSSVDLSIKMLSENEYSDLKTNLRSQVKELTVAILEAARIDNVNLRGNEIEQILTSGLNLHGLDDVMCRLNNGVNVHIDIKSKLLDKGSAPKAYNIDKALEILSLGNSIISFFIIGIDQDSQIVTSNLVSIFDKTIIESTKIQHHWAGRNSRGVTQFQGDFSSVLRKSYVESIESGRAKEFLEYLIRGSGVS